jgi:hypothetical protein
VVYNKAQIFVKEIDRRCRQDAEFSFIRSASMVCVYGVEIKSNIDFKRLIFYLPSPTLSFTS